MFESLIAGFGILLLYTLTHEFMLNRMSEDAKKPVPKTEPRVG